MYSDYLVFVLVIEIYNKTKYDSFKAHACVNLLSQTVRVWGHIALAFAVLLSIRFGNPAHPSRGGVRVLGDFPPVRNKPGRFRLIDPINHKVVIDFEAKALGAHLPRLLGR
mmetsp:Transcript_17172/g.20436  ORF Transcript_17172/g.20436 Transcript_17172/m.20436 type:complete len:111 (-) Transcript_17172:182-514(-)